MESPPPSVTWTHTCLYHPWVIPRRQQERCPTSTQAAGFPSASTPRRPKSQTYQDRSFQKPQARLFMSFLSIFNPPSQNSLYLSNFSKISKHFKFHKAQAMFILLVKCWRSRSLYCVLNFAPRCWRVAPGFIKIADPLQEVTPKAWRTWSHMGITQVGHCKGHLRVQWCG